MAEDKEEIIRSFDRFIQNNGGDYSKWSLGICENSQVAILRICDAKISLWMYKNTTNYDVAIEIIDHFIGLGAKRQAQHNERHSGTIYVVKRQTSTTLAKQCLVLF